MGKINENIKDITEEIDEIISIMDNAISFAKKSSADEIEIFYAKSISTSVSFRNDKIESAKESVGSGFGIRAVVDGASGYSGTNISERLIDSVKAAIKAAESMDGDPMWKGLPEKSEYLEIPGLYDENVCNMKLEECVENTMNIIKGISSVDGVKPISGGFSRAVGINIIQNTNGVSAQKKATIVSASADASAESASDTSTAFDYGISRTFDISPLKIGENAAEMAKKSLNGDRIDSGKMPVIFHPFAFSSLIENTFAEAIDADNVQKGRSPLIGKIGEQIANPKLSLIDDATIPGKTGSCSFDDEGTPSQRTEILKDGILKTYLYDSTTAARGNTKSSGNGFKSSYGSVTSVDLSNLVIIYPKSDIIRETKSGIYVNSLIGAHTANAITGDFSVEVRNSFKIQNGEITKPVKSAMISGNIFDLLKNISGAGYDVKDVGGIITPSIKIEDISVIGSE